MWINEHEHKTIFQRIEEKLDHVLRDNERILCVLRNLGLFDPDSSAQSAVLQICVKGEKMGADLVVNKTDNPGVASLAEFTGASGAGTQLPNAGTVSFQSDNTSVATVDSASGQLTYVGAGVANISGKDSANGLTDSAKLTVNDVTPPPPVATSAVLTLTPGGGVAANPAGSASLGSAAAVEAAHKAAAERALSSR